METIGLGGDGDELDAVLALEEHFAVALDYRDASGWRTAGDVFQSLLRALPAEKRHRGELWPDFATIMCRETGADPSHVGADTLLLALPLREIVGQWLRKLARARS